MSKVKRPRQSVFFRGKFLTYREERAIPESPIHFDALLLVAELLKMHFHDRPEVAVFGDVFLYFDIDHKRAPDLMVLLHPKMEVSSYTSVRVWEDDVPDFILEIVSPSSADEDAMTKVRLYEELGVKEYFLFDPDGEAMTGPRLVGYRLTPKEDVTAPPGYVGTVSSYDELQPGPNGRLESAVLGLWFEPNGPRLELRRTRDGVRLLDLPQAMEALRSAQLELERLSRLRTREVHMLDQLQASRDEALTKRLAAEAALTRLRAEREQAEAERQREADARAKAEAEREQAEAERQREADARAKAEAEREQAEAERQREADARAKAEAEREQAEAERQREADARAKAEAEIARLLERLRQLGDTDVE